MYFRLYGKGPGDKQFRAMDVRKGVTVLNLFYATILNRDSAERIRSDLGFLHDHNPGWKFEVRKIKEKPNDIG